MKEGAEHKQCQRSSGYDVAEVNKEQREILREDKVELSPPRFS